MSTQIDFLAKKRENIRRMPSHASPEAGKQNETSVEVSPTLIVSQPKKLEGLLETLVLLDRVSETIGEDRSGDMGGSGAAGAKQGDDEQEISLRELAIANLPDTPVMQKHLRTHIEKEVKKLQKQVRYAARRATKPGTAFQINRLYARIRRLNALLAELLEASHEMLKRLYVKIFVDKQTVI
ncbi:hypothetical protein A2454_06340 [Candidatus Peribacteria bacterium RIFOXYC2_FULL_55_14]|nr:MAG: hypothetical protein A2198_03235 [Candidatus Peribacteria bacterium RIFOXYA1_FULL_56_14]OGJ72778.1 MAG: hypothetical protein A2217_04835 [Candidatus Peribacteria bacterium RIFOXYA2_FULL_55_28]OGJ75319.1 MAG: hypothetical protein A2384_00230 [Candidatus Peribacteria bacterium RIFOXYB1_FULL_54_35]OGJ76505.1 MAG: hypothetical protein A2327_01645 [Candidatus Peribacteria bacterium RIFOXYB2_FULL_54_17]OGJ79523.1 MAG: hypothetical protein A2424_01885 [Candidatus Peribacteria bacterium RIFOXYC